MTGIIIIRGGGDLASGIALRLHRVGLKVVITELAQPMVVRRLVSYAQAVFAGDCQVEETTGKLVHSLSEITEILAAGQIPVYVDPQIEIVNELPPVALIDARMTKSVHTYDLDDSTMIIGLGPGFTIGENCHCAVETQRGHRLGRVIWAGSPAINTGIPGTVDSRGSERVLRAPNSGQITTLVDICDVVQQGDLIATIAGQDILAPFDGVVRGLLSSGISVKTGMKIGDIDPRGQAVNCRLVSDKAMAIAGGVLEGLLSKANIRKQLWNQDEPG